MKNLCSVKIVSKSKSETVQCGSLSLVRRLVELERRQWEKSDDSMVPLFIMVVSHTPTANFDYLSYYEPPLRELSEDYIRIFDHDGYSILGGKTDDVFKAFCEKIIIYYRRFVDEQSTE